MKRFLLLAALAALASCASPPAAPAEKKALLVLIDGLIPEAITATGTPAIQRLIDQGAYSLAARAESITVSGPGWSSFLTGVHWQKHGVQDNEFKNPNYAAFPFVLARLKEARPGASTASAQSWAPIESGLVAPARPDFDVFHDYYEYDDDYFDAASCDALCARDLAPVLREENVDLAVIAFAELDGVGHLEENAHYDAGAAPYQKKLGAIDAHIGALLAAIEERPSRAREDWLIIVSSDHAGSRGAGHGQDIPAHRLVPLIVSGQSAARGEILPAPEIVDVAATALAHLGVAIRPEWGLDGKPVGLD